MFVKVIITHTHTDTHTNQFEAGGFRLTANASRRRAGGCFRSVLQLLFFLTWLIAPLLAVCFICSLCLCVNIRKSTGHMTFWKSPASFDPRSGQKAELKLSSRFLILVFGASAAESASVFPAEDQRPTCELGSSDQVNMIHNNLPQD